MKLPQLSVLPALAVLLLAAQPCMAFDRLLLQAEEVITPGARATKATVTVDLRPRTGPRIHARAASLVLASPIGTLLDVDVTCLDVAIREPYFGCHSARFSAQGGPLGSLVFTAAAELDTRADRLSFKGGEQPIAGSQASFDGAVDDDGWTLNVQADGLDLTGLRALATPWFSIPGTYDVGGHIDARLNANGKASGTRVDLQLNSADLGFSNDAGTIVGQNVAASVNAGLTRAGDRTWVDVHLASGSGQALAGPVLLDFSPHPLDLRARGHLTGAVLQIDSLTVQQSRLLQARGAGQLALGPQLSLEHARLTIEDLELPGAYTSFLQIALATTDFGALQTRGRLRGQIEIERNRPSAVVIRLDDVDIEDAKDKFSMSDVNGAVHWISDETGVVDPSFLSWSHGSAYGLSGGEARVDFTTRGMGFELTRPARLPVFDGAILIRSLATRRLGQSDAELEFDAAIEPISMPLLSKAFGWPELQGSLAGQIPGLTYRNRDLLVQGDLVASVFDGTIIGRNFRLRDPLGPWPRLFADITARRLDLELVTRTFAIGTITGRLDADIEGLELFNWSPVAFNARLYSTPGDRSRKRISQKAVTSISSVGGGGGAVAAALQSGVLRFFDDFRYERLGITCELRAEVCMMGGIEPAKNGYYIVKGSRLPRIDIIGNQGRVDWPTLVSQIVAGMRSEKVIVR